MRVVVSRYNVSLGGSLWKTTLDMEDLPLLHGVHGSVWNIYATHTDCRDIPPLAHEQQSRFAITSFAIGETACVIAGWHLSGRYFGVWEIL